LLHGTAEAKEVGRPQGAKELIVFAPVFFIKVVATLISSFVGPEFQTGGFPPFSRRRPHL